jgi:3-oxoacid CoA-transferase subunit A
MIYITSDTHGRFNHLTDFLLSDEITESDVLIILGDTGFNYDAVPGSGLRRKAPMNWYNVPILCIQGNHELRPHHIDTYREVEWNGGIVYREDKYPNLLFAKDGEIYTIEGLRHIAIGGAYSVDKYYRLTRGYGWWQDEQPSEEIKAYVESQLASNPIDIILSHTCPFKYEPIEMFLSGIDQSTVDTSTEHWLDQIEETTDYKAWYCGHWHVDKRVDKMHFLFHSIETAKLRACDAG